MSLLDIFTKKPRSRKIKLSELQELIVESTSRVYLKQLSLNICINYIARAFSVSKFQVRDSNNHLKDTLYYKLNVRPNTDSSASDFWQKFIYKLISDNEVLVIKTDTDDLLIADNFQRNEYAVYEDTFTNVVVKEYEFKRNYYMSEVIYIEYNNENLESFVDDLYQDYGRLFGQMMDNSFRKNQLRGFFKFKDGGSLDDEAIEMQRAIINKMTEMFKDNSVAYAPLPENIEVDDLTPSNISKDEAVNDLVKLKRDLIDDVSKMLGVPANLIHGDIADLENTMEAFVKFCLKPLNKKVQDELNSKFFAEKEFLEGKNIKIVGLETKDPFEYAVQADKLIASGLYSPNRLLEKFGEEPSDDPRLDKHYITKNYTEAFEGEDEND